MWHKLSDDAVNIYLKDSLRYKALYAALCKYSEPSSFTEGVALPNYVLQELLDPIETSRYPTYR